ncbi:MAG: hypothetical protein ACKVS9_05320 [Phycisphaerae bacterium]
MLKFPRFAISIVSALAVLGCARERSTGEPIVESSAKQSPASVAPEAQVERPRSYDEAAAEPLYRDAVGVAADGNADATLAALARALDVGASPARALTEVSFQPLRCMRGFRELIARHARQSSIVMVAPDEPGPRMVVSGVVRARDGKPIRGALVYAFQTDAAGYYSPGGMDERNPRLFGYARTDEQGRYQLGTIRPGTYHNEPDIDQHIHFELSAPGYKLKHARLGFSDDPVWTGRSSAPSWVRPVDRDTNGTQRCSLDVVLDVEL